MLNTPTDKIDCCFRELALQNYAKYSYNTDKIDLFQRASATKLC